MRPTLQIDDNKTMVRFGGLLGLLIGFFFAFPAAATQWISDFAAAATSPAACDTPGINPPPEVKCQMTMVSGGQTVKVRAYSTRAADQTYTGQWRSAELHLYSGGFGVTNLVGGDSNEGVSPEHAVDNNQTYDVLVFELPASGFDIQAFQLGWAQESGNAWADVQAWFGGNNLASDYNFSNACFVTTSCTGTALSNLGFSDITNTMKRLDNNAMINGLDVPQGVGISFEGTQSGKYLVMAGKLGDSMDNFKVDWIKGTPGPPGGAPVPGTLALLGIAFAGLGTLTRRRRSRS